MTTVPPSFIIGVFSQPISSFPKWKARGINTLFSHEPEGGKTKKADWEAAAESAGLFFMDYPSDDDAVLPNEAKQTAMTAALSRGVFFIFTTRDSSSSAKCSLTAAAPVFFTFRRLGLVNPLRICRASSPAPQALKRARSFQTAIRGVCS